MPPSKTPIYNIKAVLKETSLKADVLRAWERRYGLPIPDRTPGGHRLYSDYDVAQLKWLIAHQQEGLSISRAVELWREQSAGGSDPLGKTTHIETGAGLALQPTAFLPETSLDSIRATWLAACLKFDAPAAENTLTQAFSLYPIETICMQIIQRGLSEVGQLWYEGRASVQQEHFASAISLRKLETLLSATPAPTRSQTLLVCCPPNEWHTFTPLLITLLLRRRGLNVIYLGANVPTEQYKETLATIQPNLVVLVAQQLASAATLQQIAASVSEHGIAIAYGGRIFTLQPDITRNIAGNFLGDRLEGVIENIEHLLATRPTAPQAVPPSKEHLETLKQFEANRLRIEATLNGNILNTGVGMTDYMEIANKHMGDNLAAGLQLGNLDYLSGEIAWLAGLLKSHQMPAILVQQYLEFYRNAVRQHLGDQGNLILAWMNTQIKV